MTRRSRAPNRSRSTGRSTIRVNSVEEWSTFAAEARKSSIPTVRWFRLNSADLYQSSSATSCSRLRVVNRPLKAANFWNDDSSRKFCSMRQWFAQKSRSFGEDQPMSAYEVTMALLNPQRRSRPRCRSEHPPAAPRRRQVTPATPSDHALRHNNRGQADRRTARRETAPGRIFACHTFESRRGAHTWVPPL